MNRARTPVERRVSILQKASPPSGGVDSWGRPCRPQVVRRPGEKAVDVVERSAVHEPKTRCFLQEPPEPLDDAQLAQAKPLSERNLALRLRFSPSTSTGSCP